MHRKGLVRIALALAFLAPLAIATSASAAPVEGPAGEAFYTPPSELPEGPSGTLIWYRPTTINLNVELPPVKAWDVLYKSTGQAGEEVPTTGTVIVPTEAWKGTGERPVVDVAEATQGLGHQCAPSLQMAAGTEYDGAEIIAALRKGYAVDVSDYQGYTNGSTPTYIAGKAEGHAVLDVAKAAPQVPGSGLSTSEPMVIWGYSQGGHGSSWAAQLQHSYAPELHVIGLATGGVPANLQSIATFNEGTPGSALALDSLIGIAYAYQSIENPEATLHELLNAEGVADVAKLKSVCAVQSITELHNTPFTAITKNHESFTEIEKHNMVIETLTNQQNVGGTALAFPVYHYHGLLDEFVPFAQDAELHQNWCSLGMKDDFQVYPSTEHLITDPVAVSHVISWIEERVAGKEAPSTCGQHGPGELPAGARLTPETGDLIIPLPNWRVTGTITAAKLGTSLKIPAGSTFSAEGDDTTGTLTASLFVPPIEETQTLFGIVPVTIRGALEQVGPITGTIGLSNTGVLSIAAKGSSNLITKSISIVFFTINLGCKTSKPITLPLEISEPANALASGNLSISDTVTIPSFTGCGPINSALVTSLLSGGGNKINITSEPQPPFPW